MELSDALLFAESWMANPKARPAPPVAREVVSALSVHVRELERVATGEIGVHQSVARALERQADANAALLRRLIPLLEAAASGAQVSMAASDLLRDVRTRLVAWEDFQP